jgi:DNA-binding Xre family transcriptional regulator
MTAKLDYQWHLRQVMAATELLAPLAQRGISLSSSQAYRLVVDRPERLSLKILMALLDVLGCTMEDLIEPVPAAGHATKTKAVGGDVGVGDLRPKRARITRVDG